MDTCPCNSCRSQQNPEALVDVTIDGIRHELCQDCARSVTNPFAAQELLNDGPANHLEDLLYPPTRARLNGDWFEIDNEPSDLSRDSSYHSRISYSFGSISNAYTRLSGFLPMTIQGI